MYDKTGQRLVTFILNAQPSWLLYRVTANHMHSHVISNHMQSLYIQSYVLMFHPITGSHITSNHMLSCYIQSHAVIFGR